jgi:hypothetical protein
LSSLPAGFALGGQFHFCEAEFVAEQAPNVVLGALHFLDGIVDLEKPESADSDARVARCAQIHRLLILSARSRSHSAAATSARPSRRKSVAKSLNVAAVKVRIRDRKARLQPRQSKLEVVKLIALGLPALVFDGGCDGSAFLGLDAASLAEPDVPTPPVRKAARGRGAPDDDLGFLAALPWIGERAEGFSGVHSTT